MKKILAILLCACMLSCMVGCEPKTETQTIAVPADFARSVHFADNVNKLMPQNENYMFSPLSIRLAFAMAANGAQDETQRKLLDALDIEDLDAFNQKAKSLLKAYGGDAWMQLHLANGVWVQSDSPVLETYAEQMRTYYNAPAKTVEKNSAVRDINKWVRENTNGKITELVSDSEFAVLLANATYMKADWENPFMESNTHEDVFNNADGTQTRTQFMFQREQLNYGEYDGVRIVELPYLANTLDVSMYVLLGETAVSNPQAILEKTQFDVKEVSLYLPKFETEFSVRLNEVMQALGAERAFDATNAQISGILSDRTLFIDSSIHKSFIRVDEQGTEAAAATALSLNESEMLAEETVEFKADKPFTYIIRDNTNGEILFVGAFVQAQ